MPDKKILCFALTLAGFGCVLSSASGAEVGRVCLKRPGVIDSPNVVAAEIKVTGASTFELTSDQNGCVDAAPGKFVIHATASAPAGQHGQEMANDYTGNAIAGQETQLYLCPETRTSSKLVISKKSCGP